MKKELGYWNGTRSVEFEVLAVVILPVADKPAHWQNSLAGTIRQVLRISDGQESWMIDNETGEGYYKITDGHGSFRCGHSSVENCKILGPVPREEWKTEVNQEQRDAEYIAHRKFIKERYPEIYERLEALREATQRGGND